MKPWNQIVISASRRTDIPAFYMPWFMEQISKGEFEVVNPFNQRVSVVPAAPNEGHTIVFWSKNFGPFLHEDFDRRLQDSGYHLFFNFTINSVLPALEPNVPPLGERLERAFDYFYPVRDLQSGQVTSPMQAVLGVAKASAGGYNGPADVIHAATKERKVIASSHVGS